MPCLVKVLDLVRVPNSLPLWPAPLRAFEERLAADPTDNATWGAAADWCDEAEVGEPELGEAFRWFHKRPQVVVKKCLESWRAGQWEFDRGTLPDGARAALDYSAQAPTVTGLVIIIADMLAKIRSELF